jgi:hypothetical protein
MEGVYSRDKSIVPGTVFLAQFSDVKKAFPEDYAQSEVLW